MNYRCHQCKINFKAPDDLGVCPQCCEGFIEEIKQEDVQQEVHQMPPPRAARHPFEGVNNFQNLQSQGTPGSIFERILGSRRRPNFVSHHRHRDDSSSSSSSDDNQFGARIPGMGSMMPFGAPGPGSSSNMMVISTSSGPGAGARQIIIHNGGGGPANLLGGGLRGGSIQEIFESLLQNLGAQERSNQRPASQDTIEGLKEIEITEEHFDNEGGEAKPP